MIEENNITQVQYSRLENSEVLSTFKDDVKSFLDGIVPVETFFNTLKEAEALISGGYVLGSINKKKCPYSDMDVYASEWSYLPILELFERIPLVHVNTTVFSDYDNSFLKRNRINKRITFTFIREMKVSKIDLLIVKTGRPVLDVVRNFDLTFCEVWFDPQENAIYGTHLEETLAFEGYIRNEYMDVFLMGNHFTHQRIRKYTSRGYVVYLSKTGVPQIPNMYCGLASQSRYDILHDISPYSYKEYPKINE